MRFKQILCLADVGGRADHAMRQAGKLARQNNASLTFLYVEPGNDIWSVLFPHQHERRIMEQPRVFSATGRLCRHAARTTGIHEDGFSVAVEIGKVDQLAVRLAEELNCDLLVIPGAEFSERIVRTAHCTVLIVRENDGNGVLAATDFSESSLPALRAGKMFARWSGQPMAGVFSLDFPEITTVGHGAGFGAVNLSQSAFSRMRLDARRRLDEAMREVHARGAVIIEHGPAVDAILRAASRLNCSLIVLGACGKGIVPRLLLGSVAEMVARHATCSVLVVRALQVGAKREAA